jgi:uncharacterized protein Smg (DUF494 family)
MSLYFKLSDYYWIMLLMLFNIKGLTVSIPIIKNSEEPLLIKVQLKKKIP